MQNLMRLMCAVVLSVIMTLSLAIEGHSYDNPTHSAVSDRAIETSTLQSYLRYELGFERGLLEPILGTPIRDRIGKGALSEDSPVTRVIYHFHNPLQAWGQAGLTVGGQLGQSSILWNQQPNQNTFLGAGSGSWSWFNARQQYLDALTKASKADREKSFADLFRSLGQGIHLLQDATVPAHVRNDQHLNREVTIPISGPVILGDPDGYEKWAKNNLSAAQARINLPPIAPPSSIFTVTGNNQAPSPIARLFDTDRFQGGNASILSDAALGITEFTNGNFLSKDTIFRDFTLPRRSDLNLTSPILETIDKRFARYYSKNIIPGVETVPHFVREGMLWRRIQAVTSAPPPSSGWVLDELVHQDYAASLLPRAVGYSASLLDYFFRGKLDVDLVPDDVDPSVLKLSGTNGSTEALVNGTLALYGDGADGSRSAVPALDPMTIANVAPDQEIPSIRFQPTTEIERYVAVYKGTLGNEFKDPANNFPGGVIGKALGGVRAEVIYPDGDRRMLRTPDGIFSLPESVDGLQKIQWGDQDNSFVGIKSLTPGSGSPDQVVAFKINRPVGASDKPPLEGPDGAKVVSLENPKAVDFPFGLPLGVTVNYNHSVAFKQSLLTYGVIETLTWEHRDPANPTSGEYVITSRQVIDPDVAEVVVDKTLSFGQNFVLTLDREHNLLSGITSTPYTWDIEEVALDSQGRPLALVWLKLNDIDDRFKTIKLQKRNRECQLVEDRTEEVAANFFPADDGIWALIDVEARSVLGVTAGQAFSPSLARSTSRLLRQMRLNQTFVGGSVDGTTQENCFDAPAMQGNPSYTKVVTGVVTEPTEGFVSVTLPGRFRNDLQPLLPDPGIVTLQLEGDAVYFVDDFTQTNRAVRIKSTQADIGSGTLSPQTIDEARIMRPIGDSPKVLVSFPQLRDSGFNYTTAKLVGWSPESPANTTLASSGQLPLSGSAYSVLSATSQTALVAFDDSNAMAFSTWLMDLANNNTLAFPGQLLNQSYVLLEPRFLYNINDTKFHTLDAALRPTALPRSLAQGSPVSGFNGAYHLIRLQ